MFQRLGLLDGAQYGAAADLAACPEVRVGREPPLARAVEVVHLQAARNVVAACLHELLQGALDAVEDTAEQTRAQLHREGMAQGDHRIAGPEHLRGFVHLHQRTIAVQADHLAGEVELAHAHLFPVGDAGKQGLHHGAVDLDDVSFIH